MGNKPDDHLSEEQKAQQRKHDILWFASATLGLCIAGYATAYSYLHSRGEEVYNGLVNGTAVVYEEGRFAGLESWDNFQKNAMTIKKSGVTYTLIDLESETSINYQSGQKPDFEKDKLEQVIITLENGESRRFLASNMAFGNEDGQAARAVFETANTLYNNLRATIRQIKREE